MKNWFVLLLSFMAALILFFVLTIFYEQSTPQKLELDTPIPIVLKSRMVEPMEFWDVVHRGIYEAAKEYGIDVKISGPLYEKEIDQQIEIVEAILNEHPPLLVLSATDYVKLVSTVEKADKMGIPVITIDSGVDSDIPVSFIATDNIAAGEKAGLELLRLLENKENPKIAIVSHIKEAASAIDREAGVRKALAGENIVGTWYCDVEEDRAYEITKELIDTYDLDGIVALNEVSSLGVARAVDEYQVKDALVVVAFDNAIRELAFLESGVIKATVVQRPYNMGYMTVKIAVDYLKGEDVPDFLDTQSVLITQENMFQREYQELLYPFSNAE